MCAPPPYNRRPTELRREGMSVNIPNPSTSHLRFPETGRYAHPARNRHNHSSGKKKFGDNNGILHTIHQVVGLCLSGFTFCHFALRCHTCIYSISGVREVLSTILIPKAHRSNPFKSLFHHVCILLHVSPALILCMIRLNNLVDLSLSYVQPHKRRTIQSFQS